MRLLGLDPGLRATGWGVIDVDGNRLSYVADGTVGSDPKSALSDRLRDLHDGLMAVLDDFKPDEAAVEETFVNRNPVSTLKLGQARGVALLTPSLCNIPVFEYAPNLIKKTVVGTGHGAKEQIQMMVKTLLPGATMKSADSADALAVAICHAHHRETGNKWAQAVTMAGEASR